MKLVHICRFDDSHEDVWVTACGADGQLYAVSDDTQGFRDLRNSNLAVSVLTGDAPDELQGRSQPNAPSSPMTAMTV
jgi:hypothetical protein